MGCERRSTLLHRAWSGLQGNAGVHRHDSFADHRDTEGAVQRLLDWSPACAGMGRFPDGMRFILMATVQSDLLQQTPAITVVQNWFAEFRERHAPR